MHPSLLPRNYSGSSSNWYDNGHECVVLPWAKDLFPNRSEKYHIVDPLALDLDGNGIQTTATAGFSGSLFDHNKDGIRTATGWVASGDGLLVRDLNGNGIIDNGGELFGENTLLADGTLAQHGYAALAELDSNADGVVDANDAAFATLRVWQDKNQDGISQADELHTLADLGIQSLNTAYEDVNQDLGNGNSIAQLGSYTKTDGSTAEMADLLFHNDHLYSRFAERIELTAEQSRAANLSGIGRVRDLREAAALFGDLSATLQSYSQADTKQVQMALLDKLVQKWAETDPQWGKRAYAFNSGLVETKNQGYALTPNELKRVMSGEIFSEETRIGLAESVNKRAILDAFTGQDTSRLFVFSESEAKRVVKLTNETYASLTNNIYKGLLFQTRLKPYVSEIAFKIEDGQFALDFTRVIATFNQIHESNPQKAIVDLAELMGYAKIELKQTGLPELLAHYVAVADETVLNDVASILDKNVMETLDLYFANAEQANVSGSSKNDFLIGDKANNTVSAGDGDDVLIGGIGNDTLNGSYGNDTYVFAKGHGQDVIYDYGSDKNDTIRFVDVASTEVQFRKDGHHLIIEGYNEQDSIKISDFFYSENYQIEKFQFSDKVVTLQEYFENGLTLTQTAEDDTVQSWSGKTILLGGAGNDKLSTYDKDDVLDGGAGNDILSAGDGNDTLIGGIGNDTLNGSYGNDTYVFAKGHGQDVIYDYGSDKNDTIRFVDVTSTEVQFRKDGNHLIIEGYNEQDSIKISDFFYSENYQIEKFQFSDKVVTLQEYFENGLTLTQTAEDDTVQSWSGKTILLGGAGNDKLSTYDKDDVLDGGAGNDILSAGDGNDTLIGGIGNDTLNGSYGNDTYVFAKGHGQDVIYDYGSDKNDTIRFVDVTSTEVQFRKDGNHLIIEGYNEQDSIKISDFFYSENYQIENFQFSDKTITLKEYFENGLTLTQTAGDDTVQSWSGKTILLGGAGNDKLSTYDKDDVLDGGAGNDILSAGDGNDTLIGGIGNDTLNGSYGNDTYVFAKGHGQDVIYDYGSDKNDTIRFVDVTSTEVQFRKDGNHLIIEGYNEQDSIKISDFFYSENYQIEKFQFSDKVVTLQEYFENGLTLTQTAEDDTVQSWSGKTILLGGAGNDKLSTYDKDDVLDGGAGNDILSAGDGNDTLIGGIGNDTLNGSYGNDTYVFAKGHGQDVIYDYGSDKNDTIRFVDVASTEVQFRKDGNHLIIEGYNEQDSIKISDFFYSENYQIENFQFSDKTVTLKDYGSYGLTLSDEHQQDSVYTHANYRLSDFVENLSLLGNAVSGEGNALNNIIRGNDLNNVLKGAAGNDRLDGGRGSDTLTGGDDADTFVFSSLLDGTVDTITDFTLSQDKIELAVKAFSGLTADNLAERVKYDVASGSLSYDPDGEGKEDAIHFATLQNKPHLTIDENHFILV
ncbi:calcium-binding protein [Alysiella filiformis]|uniref:calcium-binding protein n=2 Tax=Alysiella filiformis TaxID=194196 RepID=UPI001CCB32F6|nr:calcium-binding protein [Alysiella filiformis]UBQ55849.1 FrpA/C [Alysiella filiformis DSM 16848]